MKNRVGLGYDIHRLVQGRKLFLGGIEIPHSKGLDGHSDADVVLHAICDALLGAIGKGDIGEHFPNTDKKYKNISSTRLLKEVLKFVIKKGYQINNIDTVIQAEEPKLMTYKAVMRKHIAQTLSIDESCVNMKATTCEGLGAIGQGQGIAAFAVVSLIQK